MAKRMPVAVVVVIIDDEVTMVKTYGKMADAVEWMEKQKNTISSMGHSFRGTDAYACEVN